MIRFSCPNCTTALTAQSKLAGTTARCGGCGQLVMIPDDGTTPLPATALYAPPAVPLPPLPLPIPVGAALALPPDVNRAKIIAGCLAITLGWLGIHKRFLGFHWLGVGIALVSILGALSVGLIVPIITAGVGVTEGVLYLTRSDQDFYDHYIVRKDRPWF